MGSRQDIGVVVIGGYLGAGKTTLLNHLLSTADQRLAVLVNDFGDINIDEALIESNDGETLSLANGCICCSLIDGFASALETIRAIEPRPERLLIEASGVADPASVASWAHNPGFKLETTAVVIDAAMVMGQANNDLIGDTIIGQLRAGEVILVNKADLVEPASLKMTIDWLNTNFAAAKTLVCARGAVDLADLRPARDRSPASDPLAIGEIDNSHGGHDNHGPAHADDLFQTWTWTSNEPVTRTQVHEMMSDVPKGLERAKGILWIDDDAEFQTVLQWVNGAYSLQRGKRWDKEQIPSSQVVFIALKEPADRAPEHTKPARASAADPSQTDG